MRIPTIDLARVSTDEVARACEDVGFFTVVGHGVGDALIDEVAARSRAFFDQPDAEKERFRGPAVLCWLDDEDDLARLERVLTEDAGGRQ